MDPWKWMWWRSLKSIGQRVPGSRFIAFKVPLKGTTNQRVTQNQKFTPKDLVTTIRSQNEELGLILDLTNTERYYTTKDLPRSVQYVKLHTAGLKIPDDATIHQFKRVARRFLTANGDNDKLIGVHCTTGINRTGYLICRFLIDVDGWRPMHAISAFAQARGHPIEGTVYIEDLVKGPIRSNVGIDLPQTDEERIALNNGLYIPQDDLARDHGQRELRSILDLIPGNEFGDFDARERRQLPLIQGRSGDFQEDYRSFFNLRPEFGDGRPPPREMIDDRGLRMPFEHRERHLTDGMQEYLNSSERLRRPDDLTLDSRFKTELENRRDFLGIEPRPLMEIRDNYGPREMQGMDFDETRLRGRQSPLRGFHPREFPLEMQFEDPSSRPLPPFARGKMNNAEFNEIEAERRMHSLNSDLALREKLRRQEVHSMENDDHRFDPRERAMMSGSFRGSINERMHPRDVMAMEVSMNERMHPRDTQLMDEPINERMHPRDRRDIEDPMNKRMHPRDARLMEDSMNERMHPRDGPFMEGPINDRMKPRDIRAMEGPGNEILSQRDARAVKNLMNERMHPRDMRAMEGPMNEKIQPRDAQFMEGPINDRMHSRDVREMEGPMNERMHQRVARLMELPLNERMHPRDGRAMEGHMSERMPPRDARDMEGPMNDRMNLRDARLMEGPMNERMHPRDARAMEGPMNERMHPRDARAMEGPMNERMHPRDARAMEGPMNERMHPRDARAMEGPMNERMHPRDARAMEGPMNERMHPRDARAMEGPMNERMHPRDARAMEGPMNERMHPRDGRAMEGPMNERMHPRDARAMEGPMNERVHPRDARAMEGPMNERMHPRDARAMEGPMNERMHPRDARAMEGPMNERMHPRDARAMEGPMNERMHPRDARAMEGPMNERMHPRDALAMEGAMNERMHPRDGRAMEGAMNKWMHSRDARAMEGPLSERLHPHGAEFPMNKPRTMDGSMRGDFMNDTRPFEGRKVTPSEEIRGANRFAPYPSLMKPMQAPEMHRGPPRDPRDALPPPRGFGMREDESRFPPRSRFN
ncbi:uncharacterized protein LOC142160989 isoform X2 [Mixophyes fleayi]|uniref:uncharacterized protein LOC142160989 isoform X2 n=1 Tax=Mixophyes fleayi TaxID=3061075 RepID=UPI003F4E0E05